MQSAINGVATFDDLSIDKAASGYKLVAFDGTLSPGTSVGFTIIPAVADHLVFGVQPSTTVAGDGDQPCR